MSLSICEEEKKKSKRRQSIQVLSLVIIQCHKCRHNFRSAKSKFCTNYGKTFGFIYLFHLFLVSF